MLLLPSTTAQCLLFGICAKTTLDQLTLFSSATFEFLQLLELFFQLDFIAENQNCLLA
jgi:hypothetical protein